MSATATAATGASPAHAHGSDPKRWPLGFYYLKSAVSAVKRGRPTPRIEFYFEGALAFDLRVDTENGTQFLLVDHLEALVDADGRPLNVDDMDDDELPRSSRPGFDLIVEAHEDDDDTGDDGQIKTSLFACEVPGDEAGVAAAIERVADLFGEINREAASGGGGSTAPTLDASITHWNERDGCTETERRYVDIVETRAAAMPVRGEPHDSTVRYSQCGRNVIFLVRTLLRRL